MAVVCTASEHRTPHLFITSDRRRPPRVEFSAQCLRVPRWRADPRCRIRAPGPRAPHQCHRPPREPWRATTRTYRVRTFRRVRRQLLSGCLRGQPALPIPGAAMISPAGRKRDRSPPRSVGSKPVGRILPTDIAPGRSRAQVSNVRQLAGSGPRQVVQSGNDFGTGRCPRDWGVRGAVSIPTPTDRGHESRACPRRREGVARRRRAYKALTRVVAWWLLGLIVR